MKSRVVIVIILVAFWTATTVRAEHSEDHRYTIWGYVKDTEGTPVKDTLVAVSNSQGVRLGIARTGRNGLYSLRLHLHNSDLGRQLAVEAHDVSHQIRITFDPDNTTRIRKHRIDFLGNQALETLSSNRSLTSYILLAIGAAIVIIPACLYVTGRTKRKARTNASGRGGRKSAKATARRRR